MERRATTMKKCGCGSERDGGGGRERGGGGRGPWRR